MCKVTRKEQGAASGLKTGEGQRERGGLGPYQYTLPSACKAIIQTSHIGNDAGAQQKSPHTDKQQSTTLQCVPGRPGRKNALMMNEEVHIGNERKRFTVYIDDGEVHIDDEKVHIDDEREGYTPGSPPPHAPPT
eukprot:1161675-Pelagomonas_calceolata.AAC.8